MPFPITRRPKGSAEPTRRRLVSEGAAFATGVVAAPPIAEAIQQEKREWSDWFKKLVRAASRSRNPILKKGWAPDMKELGVAYLSIRFARGEDSFHYCIRPLGRQAGVSVVSQRLLTDGSKRQELLQGDLNGGATYYYDRREGVWPRRPPIVMPYPDPNIAALRVKWTPLYQQKLRLLAAEVGLSAYPPS
jgi:hypothetical protein